MKIITGNTVYVQKKDIIFITRLGLEVAGSILIEAFGNGVCDIDGNDGFEFVKFEKDEEVEFFKQLDCIIDYNEVKELTEDELIQRGSDITKEKNDVAKVYMEMSEEERKDNHNLKMEYDILDYKMHSLKYIIWYKYGILEMELPLIPDEKGFSYVENEDCDYKIIASIDSNKLLLCRKDDRPLSDSDRIPPGFIERATSIVVMEKYQKEGFCRYFEIEKYFTDDNKYLVIEFKDKSYDEKTHENKEQETISKKLVKKIKTIFKK